MDAADLFGSPETDAPDREWTLDVRLSDALGAVRDELHKRLESRDRICVGRQYVIPGSLCETAQSRAAEADRTVHWITGALWDAPVLDRILYADTFSRLHKVAGRDGRDDWPVMVDFLTTHRGRRVIPVWM